MQWNPYDTCDHGVDFLMHSRIECFDFCCFHLWPDNWGLPSEEEKITFAKQWITNTHCLVATKQLNKPLILSEFGKRKSHRLSYFSEVNFFIFCLVYFCFVRLFQKLKMQFRRGC